MSQSDADAQLRLDQQSASTRKLQLIIASDAYELRFDHDSLTRLDHGAAALLAGAAERLREIDIERAIERAEDWFMRFSKSFDSLQLEVRDTTGRLRRQLGKQAVYTLEQAEQAFTRVHDAVVHGEVSDRDAVADVVLLRELAHHGRLSSIVLRGNRPDPTGPRDIRSGSENNDA
jgi:hypothetical protein